MAYYYTAIHNIFRNAGCADAASCDCESGAIRSISSGYWSAAVTFKSTPVKMFTTSYDHRAVFFRSKSYNKLSQVTNNVAISVPSSGRRFDRLYNATHQFSHSCISFDPYISSSARTCTHLFVNVGNNIRNPFEIATCKYNGIHSGTVKYGDGRFIGMEETY